MTYESDIEIQGNLIFFDTHNNLIFILQQQKTYNNLKVVITQGWGYTVGGIKDSQYDGI